MTRTEAVRLLQRQVEQAERDGYRFVDPLSVEEARSVIELLEDWT